MQHIAELVHGNLNKPAADQLVEFLVTDSRKLIFPESSLFFALTGARRDGHQFIGELYERGLRNFVVSDKKIVAAFPEARVIVVRDTLKALQSLAAYHRSRFSFPVIGISGSNGKTIVKEWLNQLLEDQYQIVRSPRSYNSQIGVPLSVWAMNELNELGIFEAGISEPGEMDELEPIIRPDIGIFTNIGEAHREGFKSTAAKIKEKLKLFGHSRVLIYPSDQEELDDQVKPWAEKKGIQLFSWGRRAGSTLRIRSVKKLAAQTSIQFTYNKESGQIDIPFVDQASVENGLTCISLMLYLGLDLESINTRLLRLSQLSMRLELQEGINQCSIINDSYSADMSSLRIALDFLSQQWQHRKRTVILSDIPQSGKEEKKLYREVAALLQQKKIDRLLAIGQKIGAHETSFRQTMSAELRFFSSTDQFVEAFPQLRFRDETILIKGARSFQFEKIDRLLSQQAHQTVLEVNLNAMAHNLKQYQQQLKPATRIMAMVKAFAYGTGSFEVANLLQFHKVDYLAVAYADEAVELRKAGIHLPVMVMNTEENSLDALVQYNLEPVLYSLRLMHTVDQYLEKEGISRFPVHIEIETGMNRLGIAPADLEQVMPMLKKNSFRVQSVFSHLAASEEKQQDEFTARQAAIFTAAADRIQAACTYPVLRHLENSAAIVRNPQWQFDMVRLGIGLYGIDSASSKRMNLQEVATLKSTIAQIRTLTAGETVGYNRRGLASDGTRVATIRIGYADGYPRSLGNGAGKVLVNGQLAPTIGTISMDMTMIDITGIPHVEEGDEVVIFGKDLPVEKLAHWAQTIPYEMLTGVSQRVKRIYFEE